MTYILSTDIADGINLLRGKTRSGERKPSLVCGCVIYLFIFIINLGSSVKTTLTLYDKIGTER